MKVLKLSATYEGKSRNYKEHCLMPASAFGVIIQNFPLNQNLPEKVDFGELEGKHSECYADLIIEEIDLSELDLSELNKLIKTSETNMFEIFFEDSEFKLRNEMKDSMKELKQNQEKLYEAVNMEYNEHSYSHSLRFARTFKFLLKEKYEHLELVSIKVKKSQLAEAKKLLIKHGIDVV